MIYSYYIRILKILPQRKLSRDFTAMCTSDVAGVILARTSRVVSFSMPKREASRRSPDF